MNGPEPFFVAAALAIAVGMWLLLACRQPWQRAAGVLVVAVGLGLLGSRMPRLGDWVADSVFLILACVTVGAAVATVALRNPVYCAIWFGMTLLGTAGLFLFQGAQFLAVATIVVYAGAILVTFLFVLMLAVPKGRAVYDRLSFEALVSAFSGAVLVGILSMTVASVLDASGEVSVVERVTASNHRADGVLATRHVAALGAELFGRHLVAVEVAGTLLLAALVGAAAIVTAHRPRSTEAMPPEETPGPKDGKSEEEKLKAEN